MKSQPSPSAAVIRSILARAADHPNLTRTSLAAIMREVCSATPYAFPTVQELLMEYRTMVTEGQIQKNESVERILRSKNVRTDSGVAPITVLTKPYPCPGACVYCPMDVRMPKSYLASEPAAARALSLAFDPYRQVAERVRMLENNGHEAKKIELIIKGGTWSSYPWDYRSWFVMRCFAAANDLESDTPSPESLSLQDAQDANEHAHYRIIGLTIETRPDWVTDHEIIRLRELGCTRVELGVQTLQDNVLALTKRGHTIAATIRATALLKQAGFKVDYHLLPGQPGSTPEKDLKDFQTLFADPAYRPDMIKLYPCVVLPCSELQAWTMRGDFSPLQGEALKELLISMQTLVPRYCRVSRLIRDFPEQEISFGNKATNLREQLETEMIKRGIHCQCLRCREVAHVQNINIATAKPRLFEESYESAGGQELFLTIEDEARKAVFAFLRLRLPPQPDALTSHPVYGKDSLFVRYSKTIDETFPVLRHAAIIRELHVYGRALDLHDNDATAAQHKGYGRQLVERAEQLAHERGYASIAVISGIGVREYYRQRGYQEKQTYLVKTL